ncbi:site-specific DNA-methyltransferase [Providencia sp.]|uniref:site-specific DNA-methyltransferase n=1 Tax=Providencia sp. TaxID=589 RepID=UPI003F99FD3B
MPTLDFKGKQFVYSHHLSVPFRELKVETEKSLPLEGNAPSLNDNLIIYGDNLEALKALLPTHAGKVDCIFIDPPYNTGNEGWCYNDNVRSPLMQEWLKKSANPVDKEDLERHDKWLCMMWPRLILLKELLAESGSIWITLDENESHRMKLLCDEIFGEDNFVSHMIWEKVYSSRMDSSGFSKDFDSILVFAKDKDEINFNTITVNQGEKQFTYIDPLNGKKARLRSLRKEGSNSRRIDRPNTFYAIPASDGSDIFPIKPDGSEGTWRWDKKKVLAELGKEDSQLLIQKSKNGEWEVLVKQYFEGEIEKPVSTLLTSEEYGHNHGAAEEIKRIFGGVKPFNTPKPSKLIEGILRLSTQTNSIVLDSFAGSGTTAHAVLEANKKDNGKRKFILIECEDYADKLTAERIRRVIKGYPFKGNQKLELFSEKLSWSIFEKKHAELLKKITQIETKNSSKFDKIKKELKDGVLTVTGERKVDELAPGIGGSFTYCTLGEPIQIDSLLTGEKMPSFDALARYVFYTATGKSLETVAKTSADGFIGETDLFRIHLFYRPDSDWLRSNEAALNADKVEIITKTNTTKKRTIVFAVAKFMSQKDLTEKRIEFCQLPYAIHRIMGA